jgi:prepilin-type N-terminal cleavage/methylation domain-containing protein
VRLNCRANQQIGPASRGVYPGGIRVNAICSASRQIDDAVGARHAASHSTFNDPSTLDPETAGINPPARWAERRAAFTLVEILTVVTIIAILMTITVAVVGGLLGQAREAATNTTLSKIQSLMNSRRQAFDRLTQRKGFFTGTFEYQFAQKFFPASTTKPVASKLLQMKYFPQSANDLNFLMFTVYQNNPAAQLQFANMYPKLFQSFVNNPAGFIAPAVLNGPGGNPVTNQEILYNVLTENVIGDSPLGTDAFSASEVVTEPSPQLTTAGLPYFVDAWKGPIRFYRWPTRLFRSGGAGATITHSQPPATAANADGSYDVTNSMIVFSSLPVFTGQLWQDLGRDPDDPLQTCMGINNFEAMFHTPATYHIPLIVSAGPDGQLGMALPDAADAAPIFGRLASVTASDQLTDNLVSASIKAGGK